jgi:hypothetical protein
MSRTTLTGFALLLLLIAPKPSLAELELPEIAAGQWETTDEKTVDGVKQPATTHKSCYKPDEVQRLLAQLEKSLGGMCKMDMKLDGDVAIIKVDCHPADGISVKGGGKTRFSKKSFSGSMKITSRIDMPNMKKKQIIEVVTRGRWLGECKK